MAADPTEDVFAGVVARSVSRQFGQTRALDDVSLNLRPGMIHALVGANGAGKSTFLSVVSGRVAASSGQVLVAGSDVAVGSPRLSLEAGVATIYQELSMVPALSAAANVCLGRESSSRGHLRPRDMRRRFESVAADFGAHIDPDTLVRDLSVADQQLVEILRALESGARVYQFDEPTSSLAAAEREQLFDVMRRLRDSGAVVSIVSHDLHEVLDVADHITVFRDGAVIDGRATSEWTHGDLVESMLGTVLATGLGHATPAPGGVTRLTVRDLRPRPDSEPVSFEIAEGEVVGLAGVMGSGRSAILRSLFGLQPGASGIVELDGMRRRLPRSPRSAIRAGFGCIPEDRKSVGIVGVRSAAENVVLTDYSAVSTGPFVSSGTVTARAAEVGSQVGLPAHRLPVPIHSLSGGNQQKVVVGRWLHKPPRVLLADEPTRGVDIGAKAEILHQLRATAARDGACVLMVSSELDELIEICHRILVIADGAVIDELDNTESRVREDDLLRRTLKFGERA